MRNRYVVEERNLIEYLGALNHTLTILVRNMKLLFFFFKIKAEKKKQNKSENKLLN